MSPDRRANLIAGGLFALGLAVLGGFYLSTTAGVSAQNGDVLDTGGPYLVIEVAGSTEGDIVIDLRDDVAPNHAARLTELAESGAYDGVVFHRVIDGFMAQTGDVLHGKHDGDVSMAGFGGSDMPNLGAEFSALPFERGVVGMARSQDPDSANSQFFIMFAPAPHLNGQYTVVGRVIDGMDVVDAIRKGEARANGTVTDPDRMARVRVQDARP
jgi:peptidylprolyl isomerase